MSTLDQIPNIDSWRACSEECRKRSECNYWSWGKQTNPSPKMKKKCVLKHGEVKQAEHFNQMVSGERECGQQENSKWTLVVD